MKKLASIRLFLCGFFLLNILCGMADYINPISIELLINEPNNTVYLHPGDHSDIIKITV